MINPRQHACYFEGVQQQNLALDGMERVKPTKQSFIFGRLGKFLIER